MKKFISYLIVAALAVILLPIAAQASDGQYTITYYCSACNSPKHSDTVAMQDSKAFVGSCASNSFPLGSTIYVDGIGYLLVNDRMGKRGKIDIYRGEFDTCTCVGKFRAEVRLVE